MLSPQLGDLDVTQARVGGHLNSCLAKYPFYGVRHGDTK